MARVTYEQARADHEYLWGTFGAANDMTGGYVDGDDLSKLMKSPTKATAARCYVDQIRYWFQAGPDNGDCADYLAQQNRRVAEIRDRYL